MQSCPPILTIYIGDDVVSQPIAILKNSQPLDLTGVLEIEIDFANDPINVPPKPTFYPAKMTTSQIAVQGNPILGIIALTLAAADTAFFNAVSASDFDVIVTNSSGNIQTYRATNSLNIVQRNT